MSDSHKVSLLDLQSLDLSKYGKQKLDQNQGANRNPDSSYRRQLSESLTRKQPGHSTEQKPELAARSRDLSSGRTSTDNQSSGTQAAAQNQNDTESADKLQGEVSTNQSQSGQNQTVNGSESEQPAGAGEPVAESEAELTETTEQTVNPLAAETKQPVRQKEQVYSLFSDSAGSDASRQSLQEVTTTDGEIQPPASFQFSENQSLVKLQTDVTETKSEGAIPIPEGLAALLKNQSDTISSTESTHEETAGEFLQMDQQQDLAAEALTAQATGESVSDLQKAGLQQVKVTEELKQAIKEYQSENSENAEGSTEDSEVDIPQIIQQRYQSSGEENQSESSADENHQGEQSPKTATVEEVSRTVIQELQQPVETVSKDQTEVVEQKKTGQAETVEETVDDVAFNPLHPNMKSTTESSQSLLPEVSRTSPPTTQETAVKQQADHSNIQSLTGNQAAPVTNEVTPSAPAGPVIDVKQIDQLVERITTAVKQSHSTGQQLKIRLSPPELGTLQIEVSLKNGEYTAKLEVQNRHAQKVINDSIAQLKEALAKTGVSLDRIDVHINTESREDQRSSQSGTQSNSGNDFDSQQFSDNSQDSEQRSGEQSFVEEAVKQDEVADQDRPQVARSQGIVTENVEEIDVQI
ncbi:flagellar hook-length control protein FliK [Gimesia sp.]|uniref:flagellar hook-length control protein FliK n=1 Tax=Gimesia sp. TaxID=2024833 RepID=UPI003A921999